MGIEEIKKANANRQNAFNKKANANAKAKQENIRAQAIASNALLFTNQATQDALVELNELKLECAKRIAEAEKRVRETIDDRVQTETVAKNLLEEVNANLKGIVTGKKNNKKNNRNATFNTYKAFR